MRTSWEVKVEVHRLGEREWIERKLTNATTFIVDDQAALQPLFRVVSALLRNPTHFDVVGETAMEFEDTWLPVNIGE